MADTMHQELLTLPCNGVTLQAQLNLPPLATGIVIFAHGSGSNRHSPRNNFVANVLHEQDIATLLVDLLDESEQRDYQLRFDIGLLSTRLRAAVDWVRHFDQTSLLPVGLFGASTGAAAALSVAAEMQGVAAVVSRGGRVDMAGDALAGVTAPTLLIVGELDKVVLDLNRGAFDALRCEKRLETIPGASHLFEEPGKLETASALAAEWFFRHLKLCE